ncbi:sensor domain-containing diguanylate cyclase [Arcobacter vandammei]|uniref:sensor domain-containing diguanylate cyclase n=1 Tax=Arcobacter vandammei TaxID=2782243 RepID=UPI0018DF188B|nr:diguanylate cyclase [Arcobacter vandammei]
MLGFIKRSFSLRGTILSLFFIISLILISIVGIQLFYFSEKTSLESIDLKLHGLTQNISTAIQNDENSNFDTINMLSLMNDKTPHLELYVNVLKSHPYIYSIYSGYEDNSFFQVINLNSHKNLRAFYNANENDRWLKIEMKPNNKGIRDIILLDKDLNINSQTTENTSFNPKSRPWYIKAIDSNFPIKTDPYKFYTIDTMGFTYAKKIAKSKNVIALDLLSDYFSHISTNHIENDYMDVFLFNEDGLVVSSLNQDLSLINEFYRENKDFSIFTEAQVLNINSKKYIVQVNKIKTDYGFNYLGIFADYNKSLEPYRSQSLALLMIFAITTLIIFPIIILFSNKIINPIYNLVEQINNIKNRNYEGVVGVEASTIEVNLLSRAFKDMANSIFKYQNSLEQIVESRTKELKQKNEELERLSITDKLTNIYNRVKLDSVLNSEFIRSKRYDTVFCVIMLDIDFFKKVNDNFGHHIGDDVLVEVAQIIKSCTRATDTFGRWGGEEFLIICPNTNINGAKSLAYNINQAVKLYKFKTYPENLTISLGIANFNNEHNKAEDIVSDADKALYKAKQDGRDRVVVFQNDI